MSTTLDSTQATVRPAMASTANERCVAYERARDACDAALAAAGDTLREMFFDFGGKRVRMRVCGAELAEHLSRPFAHLRVDADSGASVELSIDVWDEREVHVPYPSGGDNDPLETSWPAGHGMLAVSPATRYVRYDCTAWVTWIDRAQKRIIGWRSNADRLSMHERTRPMPFLLPIWYADRGVHIIHAGLVARNDKGVLFCGSNGAGKSTTSLACLCAGMDFLSDDHVGLEERDGRFIGHSVFGSTRLEPDHMERALPELLPYAIRSPEWFETKSLVLVAEAMPERVKPSVPIRAIVLPFIVDAESPRLVPATRAEALRALAPSTLMQMPFGATPDRFKKLAELAMSVPAYRLELGRDVTKIAPIVTDLIARLD